MAITQEKAALRTMVANYLGTTDLADVATFGEHKAPEATDAKGNARKASPKDDNTTFATISIPMDVSGGIIIGGRKFYPSSMQVQVSAFHLSPTPYTTGKAVDGPQAATASSQRLNALLKTAPAYSQRINALLKTAPTSETEPATPVEPVS